MEVTLHLDWASQYKHCRIFADCNLVCLTIDNDTDEWEWRSPLGMSGWLQRWEMNGWRTTKGDRVRHSDIWKCILWWLRLFESSPDRCVEVTYVKTHAGCWRTWERALRLSSGGKRCATTLQINGGVRTSNWFLHLNVIGKSGRKMRNSMSWNWMLVQKN